MLKLCISVVQLISCVSSLPHVSNICSHCQRCFTNLVDHCIHECIYLKASLTFTCMTEYLFADFSYSIHWILIYENK